MCSKIGGRADGAPVRVWLMAGCFSGDSASFGWIFVLLRGCSLGSLSCPVRHPGCEFSTSSGFDYPLPIVLDSSFYCPSQSDRDEHSF